MKQLLTVVVLVCAPVFIFSHTGYMTDHENSHNFGTNFGGYSNTLQLGSGGGLAGSLNNFFNPQQLALGFGLGLAKAMVLAALGAGFSRARSSSHRNDNPDKSYGNQNSAYISKSIISHTGNDDRYRGDIDSYQGKNPNIYSKYMDHTLGDTGDYNMKSGHSSYGALPHQGTSSVSYPVPSYNGQSYGDSHMRLTKGDYNVDQTSGINGKYGDTSTSTFSYGRSNGVHDYKDMYQIQPSYSYNTIARSGSVRYQANDNPGNYDYSAGNAKYGGERNTGLDLFSLHRRFAKAKTTLLRGLLSPLASLNILGGGSGGQETYQRSNNNNYDSHNTNNPKPSFSLSPSLGLGAYLGAKAGLIKGVIMSRVLSDSGILKSDDGY